ncbi:MAG: hypothetical protein GX610_13360 [Rhodococcus sp.]|nr:hypothetical protein [Rhodococcus sp. (in: high G+C Gram-positive bacteria)]
MKRSATLAAGACAAVAALSAFTAPAGADPLTDFLCNSGSVQMCPPPPPAQNCHSSYDPCVPIASDVDCEGGNGNGPVYTGPVRVTGPDEYGLDRNNDGFGCEDS